MKIRISVVSVVVLLLPNSIGFADDSQDEIRHLPAASSAFGIFDNTYTQDKYSAKKMLEKPARLKEVAPLSKIQTIPIPSLSKYEIIPDNERRTALIIGNSAYQNVSVLNNPTNDANDIGEILEKFQFDVTLLLDANRTEILKAVRIFGQKLKAGGVGLFYYAGHGVQIEGQNYLIPIDANIQEVHEIEAMSVNRVLGFMDSAKNRLNMVILDACRNNPFSRSFRSLNQGLAQMDAPLGTLVAYATSPGKVAADGNGENGVYTKHLLKQLQVPNIEVTQMFKSVRRNVRQETENRQIPWESTSLEGDFYFVRAAR